MEKITINISPKIILIIIGVLIVVSVSFLAGQYVNDSSQKNSSNGGGQSASVKSETDAAALFAEINPPEGYEINAVYGDIGPKLIEAGAIDLQKFKNNYEKAGQPLTQEQLDILTKGSNAKIKITPENSYFLLNFLWAAGVDVKNPILEKGAMVTSGTPVGNFASTGGWTLGKDIATSFYSKYLIVNLTAEQQKALEDFTNNSYRPCCGNSTAFPDCNHGMAMLGLGEIMASQGLSAKEMFEAFKYVNAFWFPQNYFDMAKYFKAKEGKGWKDVDARTLAGVDYSSSSGSQRIKQWLSDNNLIEKVPSSGGGCGV